ncbi:autophagy protein 16 [[Candida] railenensis]|uniref:Autophagy protein 16 n=1 Tax=[Candida] railenensis TaxID=45579 RepID=A0A9P0QS55_9ASCO|nr:autophagy protein 16 [[Candida] railenensis]
MTWEDRLDAQLEVRDQLEKADSQYFSAFNELLERTIAAEKALAAVKQTPSSSEVRSSGIKDVVVHEELLSLQQENSQLVAKLNDSSFEIQSKNARIRSLEASEQKLSKNIDFLKKRVTDMRNEVQEKNKSIEIINDEILSSQIQNNVLAKKVDELSQENEGLIKRWIDKVRADAERMNEVNELLEAKSRSNGAGSEPGV